LQLTTHIVWEPTKTTGPLEGICRFRAKAMAADRSSTVCSCSRNFGICHTARRVADAASGVDRAFFFTFPDHEDLGEIIDLVRRSNSITSCPR
jgi:hypothetical protein